MILAIFQQLIDLLFEVPFLYFFFCKYVDRKKCLQLFEFISLIFRYKPLAVLRIFDIT